MATTWKDTALSLYERGYSQKEISDFLWNDPIWSAEAKRSTPEKWYNKVRNYIYDRTVRRVSENEIAPPPKVVVQNQEPDIYNAAWDGATIIKFGLMGDTQIGSKYTQITHLREFYDICERLGIPNVYHTGDITDGLKMRPGHEYELYMSSSDDLVKHIADIYPKKTGITTHFITGNHDASIYKQVGHDIGASISKERSDMKYLGRDCAIVNLTPNCTLEMRHPWDGTAYATSYKPQKIIEAMESDSKPNILAIGHYHKAEYLFHRNVNCFQTGCFQSQTPFTRGKGISINMGGWIVYIAVSDDGTVKSISPTFVPFYKAITDDYKNYI